MGLRPPQGRGRRGVEAAAGSRPPPLGAAGAWRPPRAAHAARRVRTEERRRLAALKLWSRQNPPHEPGGSKARLSRLAQRGKRFALATGPYSRPRPNSPWLSRSGCSRARRRGRRNATPRRMHIARRRRGAAATGGTSLGARRAAAAGGPRHRRPRRGRALRDHRRAPAAPRRRRDNTEPLRFRRARGVRRRGRLRARVRHRRRPAWKSNVAKRLRS